MRIVFLTNDKFYSSEKFRYMFAYVAASFPDVHVRTLGPDRLLSRRGIRRSFLVQRSTVMTTSRV